MKKIALISAVFLCVILLAGVVMALSNEECYQLASNKDNTMQNMNIELKWSGNRMNPCTGLMNGVDTYYSDNGNSITQMRSVYSNGDAEGYIGMTRYWVCHSNQTAKIYQRIYGPIWGKTPWGFWLFFPFDDDPSTWVKDKEICNTLD